MPFLKQSDFKNIMQAKKDGNPQAIAIMQSYVKGCTQYDLDNMVHAFYNPDPVNIASEQEADPMNAPAVEAVENAKEEIDEASAPETSVDEPPADEPPAEEPPEAVEEGAVSAPDISAELDADLDGLIDCDEISDCSFEDFLKEKRGYANRMSKGADHFKMYDPAGRMDYLVKKCDEYDKSFDTKRKDIERSFRDLDGAITAYSSSVSGLPDDGIELDSKVSGDAYSDFVDSIGQTHSFGRVWDEEDMEEMNGILSALVAQYGKANVVAALNVIHGDNEAFKDKRNGQIDSAVKHYSKQLEDLLK